MIYIGGRSFGKTRKLLEQKEKEIIKNYLIKKYLLLVDQKAPIILLELIYNLIQEIKNE